MAGEKLPTGRVTPKAPATPAQAAKTNAKGDRAAAKIPAPTKIKPVGK
jgi:hypothetical protein